MAGPNLRESARVWAQVGVNSFGGPAGQIAVMHTELVRRRGWVSDERFAHALSYCMVLPGPEAQQLATYLGWVLNGVRGGVLAGVLFVLPGFAVMLGLAAVYVAFGTVPLVAAALAGVQAAVVAIVVAAVQRMAGRTLTDPAHWLIAIGSFLAISGFAVPFPVVIVVAGLAGYFLVPAPGAESDPTVEAVPSPRQAAQARRAALVGLALWLVPVVLLVVALGMGSIFTQQALLFSKSAVITFGGAYAVLGYIAQQAVQHHAWLSPQEMLAGLGLAESTPGPLILVTEFVAFVAAHHHPGGLNPWVAGTLAAVLTTWVTFVPSFVFIFAGAPYVERLRRHDRLRSALASIGAAVTGVILNLAVWFALHVAFAQVGVRRFGSLQVLSPVWSSLQWWSVVLAVVAGVLIWVWRWPTLRVLGLCAGLAMAQQVLAAVL